MKQFFLLVFLLVLPLGSALGQATPNCSGSNDTAAFSAIITAFGANSGTIVIPYKSNTAQRCALNALTVPANVTLDNTNGSGIKINTGQTVIIRGPIFSPLGKQFFYNATAGLGTVSLSGNTGQSTFSVQWWGDATSAAASIATTSIANKVSTTSVTTESSQTLVGVVGPQGLNFTANEPNAGNNNSDRVAMKLLRNTTGSLSSPDFSNESNLELLSTITMGQNDNDGAGKRSFFEYFFQQVAYGAGQRFIFGGQQTCYGMGDCFASAGPSMTYLGGLNASGDEGIGRETSDIKEDQNLWKATISAVSATTCNTTLTQAVTRSQTAQTVTVASTSGCVANDWITVERGTWMVTDGKMEGVKITAVGSGTITGVFKQSHSNGSTVTPATVLTVSTTAGSGQLREVVNLSGSTYTTGNAFAVSGANAATGVGTTWTDSMVGGDATLPGCIAFTDDDETGSPFGAGALALKAWYPLSQVTTTTSLGMPVKSQAGNVGYNGTQTSAAAYTIRPCGRILAYADATASSLGSRIVLETNTFTWTVSDQIEYTHSTQYDVQGWRMRLVQYQKGGVYRSGFNINNDGLRRWSIGYGLQSSNAAFAVANPAFDYGFYNNSFVGVALATGRTSTEAILISSQNTGERATIKFSNGGRIASTIDGSSECGTMIIGALCINFRGSSDTSTETNLMKLVAGPTGNLNTLRVGAHLELIDPTNNIVPILYFTKASATLSFDMAGFGSTDQSITYPTGAANFSTTLGLILSNTATLNFDLTAVDYEDLTVNVTNAAVGDGVSLGIPNGSVTASTGFYGWVSSAGVVTVRAFRWAGTPNPASGTFTVIVQKK